MKALDTFERKALLPISRVYGVTLSFIALLALCASALCAAYFHYVANRDPGTTTTPSISTTAIVEKLSAKPATPPPPQQPARTPTPNSQNSAPDNTVTPLQAALAKMAAIADPEKKIDYFNSYEEGADLTQKCAGGFIFPFVSSLTEAVTQAKKSSSPATFNQVSAAVCSAWQSDLSNQRLIISARAVESVGAIPLRTLALTVLLGSLVAVAVLALPLALFAIERNTRSVETLSTTLKELAAKNAHLIIFFIFFCLAPISNSFAQVQIETEQQRIQRQAQEAESRRAANLRAEIAQRSSHMGKTYVFNPSGQNNGLTLDRYFQNPRAPVWFYREPPAVFSDSPNNRFRPQSMIEFTILGTETKTCYRSQIELQYAGRFGTPYNCVYYKVRIGQDLNAYLDLGRYGRAPSDTQLEGMDALGHVSFDPKDMILIARPEQIAARAAAERNAQAEREANAKREAAAREADRQAAALREEEARRKATLERRRQELTDKYSADVADAVINGRVEKGWPMAIVEETWGRPQAIKRVPPTDELWRYQGRYVTFIDGKVNNIVIQ